MPEKNKNLYLISLKWKMSFRKAHTSFWVFKFLVCKIGANWFSIKFCIRKCNVLFPIVWMWHQEKQPNLKILANIEIFSVAYNWKLEKTWTNFFLQKLTRIPVAEKLYVRIWFAILSFLNNNIFYLKGKRR